MREASNGYGEQDRKGANGPRKGEGTSQGKLGGMAMMGGWMEGGAHLGIGVKLITNFPSSAYWDG
jgi:hypothetical protein